MGDLKWLRGSGLADAVKGLAEAGTPVAGICGGYQMLGRTLRDPDAVEEGGELEGLGLLPIDTVFEPHKVRTRMGGRVLPLAGFYGPLSGSIVSGYEIHMGITKALSGEALPFAVISGAAPAAGSPPADGQQDGFAVKNVFGSYLHGLFDSEFGAELVRLLLSNKGLGDEFDAGPSTDVYKETQYDILAQSLRKCLDFRKIYEIMGIDRG
jgi:adenosylcobyric acid synthase